MRSGKLSEIAILFLKLGTIAFGGPAAHIAMMEDEVVQKRKWMSQEHFLDLIGATNIIPGPNSTEMTMHCGYERAGWKGLVVAGLCFIFPAVIITSILAWLYVSYGTLPEVEPFLYGIKPAVIAIILTAGYRLARKAVKNRLLAFLGLITLLACLFGMNEIASLFGCGLLGLMIYFFKSKKKNFNSLAPLFILQSAGVSSLGNLKIFLSFLKIGAILYGSGYVLFAFLDAELVANGWLSRQELLDAIAVGQFTPGPVLSTATFIGWELNGPLGALAATTGIFLPSFLFVLLLNPLIPRMRKSAYISAFLDAVNVGAVALIFAVCFDIGKESLTEWPGILIAVTSLAALLLHKKTNNMIIVFGGAVAGYLLRMI